MIYFDPDKTALFNPPDLDLPEKPKKCLLIFDDEIWETCILGNASLESPSRTAEKPQSAQNIPFENSSQTTTSSLSVQNIPFETSLGKNSSGKFFDNFRYLDQNGEKILLVYPPTGASATVCDTELLIASGIEKIVAFGTCGRLKPTIAKNTIIFPSSAIREEGTSYHYLPDSDKIPVDPDFLKLAKSIFAKNGFKTQTGKIWTTDAVYRETAEKAKIMADRGCLGVDMELSALLALAKFRNIKFFEFLIGYDAVFPSPTADTLDPLPRNNPKILSSALTLLNQL